MADNNKPTTHSFYQEMKKSLYKDDKFNKEKAWKLFKKIFKWSFYIFFMITAIWGCVNEFIIKTGGGLSQNVEFYSSKDEVVPNIYRAEKTVGYEWVGEREYVAPDGETTTSVEDGLLALPFYTYNPNYGNTEIDNEEVNTTDLIIPVGDITDADNNPTPFSFTYQVTREDFNALIEFVLVDNQQLMATQAYAPGGNGLVVNPTLYFSLPVGLEDLVADEYEDKTWTNFYASLADEGKLIKDGKAIKTKDDFFAKNDDGEIVGVNGYAVPEDPSKPATTDWHVVETVSFSSNNAETKVQYLTNYIAFNTGSKIDSSQPLDEQLEDRAILTNTDTGEIVTDKSINDIVNDSLEDDDEKYNEAYVADFDWSDDFNWDGGEYVFGEEYFVVASPKQDTLVPSKESLVYMYDARDPLWYENQTPDDRDYLDPRVQNAGWGLFDEDGNLIQLYSSSEDALNSDPSEIDDDGLYFYAQQRKNWEGQDPTDVYVTPDGEIMSYYSFQQMLNDYVDEGYYVADQLRFSIVDSHYQLDYTNEFIGMNRARELSGYTKPQDQYGTSLAVVWQKESDSGGYVVDDEHYNTQLDQSVASVGYDGTNSSHAVFAGWSDWGQAWSITYGPLYGFFLFPISQIALMIQGWMPIYIWGAWGVLIGVFVIVFLLRGLGTLLSFKTTSNQQKMQEVQVEVAKINAKYEKYGKNPQMKQRKQMEIMSLYRKHEINPLGSLGSIFITMPIFITMWILISSIPQYKIASIGAFSFSVSPFYGIFNIPSMFLFYLLIGILVGLVQGISAKLPGWLARKRKGIKTLDESTKQAMKKSSKTQNIMIGVFVFIGLTVPTLLAFYWIASSLFTITLELGRHFWKLHKAKTDNIKKEA